MMTASRFFVPATSARFISVCSGFVLNNLGLQCFRLYFKERVSISMSTAKLHNFHILSHLFKTLWLKKKKLSVSQQFQETKKNEGLFLDK